LSKYDECVADHHCQYEECGAPHINCPRWLFSETNIYASSRKDTGGGGTCVEAELFNSELFNLMVMPFRTSVRSGLSIESRFS
jgi:hypothetical protein